MNIKIVIIIWLFSFPIFGQINAQLNPKLKKINSQVKFIDSIANFAKEEVSLADVIISHGRTDGKPIRKLFTNTRTVKYSSQIIRICQRERFPDYDEDLDLYFFENKLVYAERSRWKGRRNKLLKQKFYYENESEISHQNIMEGIHVKVKAESLMKQASR